MSVSISDLERGLSKARLQPYRNVTANDTDALCMYMRNMELSYGLYPVLQSVEVALRNGIHDAGVQAFQAADWFRDSAIPDLATTYPAHICCRRGEPLLSLVGTRHNVITAPLIRGGSNACASAPAPRTDRRLAATPTALPVPRAAHL